IDDDTRARRRLKGFALHLMAYFVVILVCAALNHLKSPDQLWFIYPMVAWGAPLALHAAWVMGLFDGLTRRK
ncbi:MAG: 2TM domain-containing protein, partial [Rhodospirillales bacterium]